MIKKLAKDQYWARFAPFLGVISAIWLFSSFKPTELLFWAYINIPLYLFHQTEEHLWPGGFKNFINQVINKLPEGEETLTDKRFLGKYSAGRVAFTVFGVLAQFYRLWSMYNCFQHYELPDPYSRRNKT